MTLCCSLPPPYPWGKCPLTYEMSVDLGSGPIYRASDLSHESPSSFKN